MKAKEILIGLLLAVLVALFLSPFASQWPDGLEKVADDKGFLDKGEIEPAVSSPVPDYSWPGIKNEALATSVAGVFGTIMVFAVSFGLLKIIGRKT
jgi:cobalt/nickel transport protein